MTDEREADGRDNNNELVDAILDMDQRRRCVRCATTYRELDNQGTWRCAYHPGHLSLHTNVDVNAGNYTCCNVSPNPRHKDYVVRKSARGCKRCDHIEFGDQWLAKPERMDLAIAQRFMSTADMVIALGVRIDHSSNLVYITRAEPEQR